MDLRHLRALEAVLETGSFTAAAAACHVSQPALWAQVKELENELGLPLFTRVGRGVVPTGAALALRPRLENALFGVEELKRAAGEIRAGAAAPARVGCAPSHVSFFLAGCIHEVMRRNPHSPFPVLVPVTSRSATEVLSSGKVDLLVEPRAGPARPNSALLYALRLVAVGGKPGARSRKKSVELRELARRPIATLPDDSLVRRMLEDAATSEGVPLRTVFTSRDASALLALGKHGLCTAVLSDEMLEPAARKTAATVLLRGRELSAPLWLSWGAEESLSPAAKELRKVMLERRSISPGERALRR